MSDEMPLNGRQFVGLSSQAGMVPIVNIAIISAFEEAPGLIALNILSNLAFSAMWCGIAYAISKHAFKHDMTKSLKIAGIVAGSVCALMFAFLSIDFLVRVAKDGTDDLGEKFAESTFDTGLLYTVGTGGVAPAVGLLEVCVTNVVSECCRGK